MAIAFFSADYGVELFLDRLGDRADSAFAHFDLVDGANRSDLGRGAGEEGFIDVYKRQDWAARRSRLNWHCCKEKPWPHRSE